MRHVTEYSKQELNDMLKRAYHTVPGSQEIEFETEYGQGKPAAAQLDMNMGLLEFQRVVRWRTVRMQGITAF